jgi:DNA-directed RNA polymerase subunit RPC12/RpoP
MCRYAFNGPYKDHYACFNCQKTYKQKPLEDLTENENNKRKYLCPECGEPMKSMGLDFRSPKKTNHKQWKKLKLLYMNGFTFHSCGCGTGPRPATLGQVKGYLEDNKVYSSEGERLLQQFKDRR